MYDGIAEYRVELNRVGRWYWHMIAGNGRVIETSGQSFASQDDAMRACENARDRAARAPIKVHDAPLAMQAQARRLAAERVLRTPQDVLGYMIDARREAQARA
jgi:uncharacterized protein YegP (UPF0339 family)